MRLREKRCALLFLNEEIWMKQVSISSPSRPDFNQQNVTAPFVHLGMAFLFVWDISHPRTGTGRQMKETLCPARSLLLHSSVYYYYCTNIHGIPSPTTTAVYSKSHLPQKKSDSSCGVGRKRDGWKEGRETRDIKKRRLDDKNVAVQV